MGDNTTGIYNTSAYRLEHTDGHCIYNNKPGHVRIYNLQAGVTVTNSATFDCIGFRLSTRNVGAGRIDNDCRFINCIAKVTQTGTWSAFGWYDSPYADDATGSIIRVNCIAYAVSTGGPGNSYGFGSAFNVHPYLPRNYNCTAYACDFGFVDPQITINCLAAGGSGSQFNGVGTGFGLSDYNASSDTTAVGTNKRISQTFSFVNAGAGNFNLGSGDTGAMGFGVTDPASGLYLDNIIGTTRTVPWNIGAW